MKKLVLLTFCLLLSLCTSLAQTGRVYLVGAGPGDPDLITLKGIKVLHQADVVLYDALSNPSILLHCKKDVRLIPVGKRAGKPSPTQEEINALLIKEAKAGHTVVRLKGGDPFVFGRGGEELLALLGEKIRVYVVPGVTAAIAAPAYAGIPVTHRALARTFTLVTASTKDKGVREAANWKALAEQGGTIAFYMGVRVIPDICKLLIDAGMSPDTPAAIISKGTLPEQKAFRGKLRDFTPDYTDYSRLTPGLLLVGDVVDVAPEYKPGGEEKGAKVLCITHTTNESRLGEKVGDEVALFCTLKTDNPSEYSSDYLALLKEVGFTHVVFSNSPSFKEYEKLSKEKGIELIKPGATLITLGQVVTDLLREHGYESTPLRSYDEIAKFITEGKGVTP